MSEHGMRIELEIFVKHRLHELIDSLNEDFARRQRDSLVEKSMEAWNVGKKV